MFALRAKATMAVQTSRMKRSASRLKSFQGFESPQLHQEVDANGLGSRLAQSIDNLVREQIKTSPIVEHNQIARTEAYVDLVARLRERRPVRIERVDQKRPAINSHAEAKDRAEEGRVLDDAG